MRINLDLHQPVNDARARRTGRSRIRPLAGVLAAAIVCSVIVAPAADAQRPCELQKAKRGHRGEIVRTVPKLKGVTFTFCGRRYHSNKRGKARIPVASRAALEQFVQVRDIDVRPGVRARFSGWYRGKATFALYYAVRLRFVDVDGNPVDPAGIRSVELVSSNGLPKTYTRVNTGRRLWLQGRGIVPAGQHEESKEVSQAVERVEVEGSNVVNRGQQRFYPARGRDARIELLFFSARFEVRDALFGFPIGSQVELRHPNRRIERRPLGEDGNVQFRALPRGDYKVSIEAAGWGFDRPMSLSRDQNVRLQVISYFDIGVIVFGLIGGALAILFIGRPHLIPVYGKRFSRRRVAAFDRS